jgi:RHS repeat-associated protein
MGFETRIERQAGAGFLSVYQTHQFGRLATLQYPGGETLTYGYDGEGYLASVSGYVNAMTRNARGQLTSMVYANGVTTAIAYDNPYDLMSSIAVTGPQGPLYQAAYTYNDASQVTAISSSTHTELNVSYAYDDLYRLLSVTRAGQGTPYQTYAYDAIGNPTQASDLGSYLYTQLGKPHAATQAGTLRYAYDANGNVASATTRTPDCVQVGRLMSWDSEDRLAFVSAAGKTTRYGYTADGQRNKKEGPVDTVYFYGQHLEVRNPDDGGLTYKFTKYIYAGPVLVAKSESETGAKHWYHQDHLSSTVAMSDATGALAKKTEYEAFGQEIASTGEAKNLRGYGSHWRDDESGLLYMGARYYDPALVRFTQPDSVVPEPDDPQSWNRYSYTRNNPVNRIDPTGHADISAAADLADAYDDFADRVNAATQAYLESGGPNIVDVMRANDLVNAGRGFADTLRFGEGIAEGGWRGYATDALRATGIGIPIARALSPTVRALAAEIAAARAAKAEIAAAKAAKKAAEARKASGSGVEATRSGIGVTRHGVDQKITRGVRTADELDAIRNPLETRPVTVDKLGRPSQRSVGRKAEVVRNPDTGKIVSVNPTSSKKAERLLRQKGSDE